MNLHYEKQIGISAAFSKLEKEYEIYARDTVFG